MLGSESLGWSTSIFLQVMIRSKSGLRLIPEIYAVPKDKVEQEQASPGSQPLEVAGRVPFMWAQSLYIVGRLLKESLVALGEIDPMNRRLGIQTKPEVIVQVRFRIRLLRAAS